MKNITVRIDKNFGNEAIYPVCDDAHTFARMVGQKTLTSATLKHIEALGYTISVAQQTLAA